LFFRRAPENKEFFLSSFLSLPFLLSSCFFFPSSQRLPTGTFNQNGNETQHNSYGASLQGITPLLSALVSSSPGVTVCNIDNGFGAAMAAARILRTAAKLRRVQKAAATATASSAAVSVSA